MGGGEERREEKEEEREGRRGGEGRKEERRGGELQKLSISFKGTIPATLVPSTRPYLSKVLPSSQRLLTKSFIHSSGGQFKIQTVKDSAVTSPDRFSWKRNEAFLLFVKSPRHIFVLIQPTKPSSTGSGLENTELYTSPFPIARHL